MSLRAKVIATIDLNEQWMHLDTKEPHWVVGVDEGCYTVSGSPLIYLIDRFNIRKSMCAKTLSENYLHIPKMGGAYK